jgi:hypothetical protein
MFQFGLERKFHTERLSMEWTAAQANSAAELKQRPHKCGRCLESTKGLSGDA